MIHRPIDGMSENDLMTMGAMHVSDVNCFFQLVLESLTDHFDIAIYKDDFPFP